MIRKLLEQVIKTKMRANLEKTDKEMVKKHPEWIRKNNHNSIRSKKNNYFLIIMQNIYDSWNDSIGKDFISDAEFQTELLPKLNWINNGFLGIINDKNYLADKNYQNIFLNKINMPKTIIRVINGAFYDSDYKNITKQKALSTMKQYKQLVFKISIGSSHGRGVELVQQNNYEKALTKFGNNIIVQKVIEQSPILKQFNCSSVNIIRITSILIKSRVYILSSILRVGAPGSFCDHQGYNNVNPLIIKINDNGQLSGHAVDPDGGYIYSSIFGKKIEGKIPNYTQICDDIKKEHLKLAHTKIIGWDLTLDKDNNPICVEFNTSYPGIVQSQMVCGPIFSKKTIDGERIIDLIRTGNI